MGATYADLEQGLQSDLNAIETQFDTNPGVYWDELENVYYQASAYTLHEQNGHLDAADQQAVLNAHTAASNVSKVAAGTASAFTLGATRGLFQGMAESMDRLPGPFRGLARPFRLATSAIARAENRIIAGIAPLHVKMLRNHLIVHGWSSDYLMKEAMIAGARPTSQPAHKSPVVPFSSKEGQKLQREITDIYGKLGGLAHALGIEQHNGAVPRQVWDSIHTLQVQVHQLQTAVTDLSKGTNVNSGAVASLEHQIHDVEHRIAGVATVTTTWADVATALQQHVTTLTNLYTQTNTEQHHQHNQLLQLAPLAMLLQPGVRGLRTLRQLEDTPCMCPKPDLSGIKRADALAAYLFMTHG